MGIKKHFNVKRQTYFRKKIYPNLPYAQNTHFNGSVSESAAATLENEDSKVVEVYKRLRFFLLLSQTCLCAPASAHRRRIQEIHVNVCLLALHICWYIVVYIVVFGCFYHDYVNTNVELPIVLLPLRLGEYAVYTLHVLHIAVGSYWARSQYTDLIKSLLIFDQQLQQQFNEAPDYRKLTKFLRIHLTLITIHFICIAITDFYYNDDMLSFVLALAVRMLPNIIFETSLMQYYTLLYMISIRGFDLNRVLEQHLDAVNHAEDNANDTEKANKFLDNIDLQCIRKLYAHLERLTREVNDSFGISLVLCYVASFTNLTINVFLIYDCFDRPSASKWTLFVYSIIWSAMNMSKMFLILHYNDAVEQQKGNTVVLLNKYNSRNSAFEETITHFILQLTIKTRSNVVCSVTALDMEFITSILTTLSTMFIFLLQYNMTFEALSLVHKTENTQGIQPSA